MAIARPVTKTIISTTAFGIPVVDWINANTPTPWTNPTLTNGWTQANGRVSYRKVGDVVSLRGSVRGGTAGTAMMTLPVGFRPAYNEQFATVSYAEVGGGNGWVGVELDLTTDGNLIYSIYNTASSMAYVALTAVIFSTTP